MENSIGRISTTGLYQRSYDMISKSYNEMNKTTEMMGKEDKLDDFLILAPTGDVSTVMNMNREVKQANTYIHNCTMVQLKTEAMYNALERLRDIAQDMLNALYSHTSPQNKFIIEHTAKYHLQEIESLLNTSMSGYYLFGGSKANEPPIQNLKYMGDNILARSNLSDNCTIEYGISGNHKAFYELIAGVSIAFEYFDTPRKINEAKHAIKESIQNIIELQEHVGYNYAIASKYKEIHQNTKAEMYDLKNDIESDYNIGTLELIGKFSEKQSILQAMHHSFNTLSSLSLAKQIK